jgi:hypothetical protein
VADPGRVAIGTDLDGNYQPILTSYHQLADLAGLLHDRGLPVAHARQILGRQRRRPAEPHQAVTAGRARPLQDPLTPMPGS